MAPKKKTVKKTAVKVKEEVRPVEVATKKEVRELPKDTTLVDLVEEVISKVYGGDRKLGEKVVKNFLKGKLNSVE